MSTLTHERTDLFIGGAWQPSSDQELTPIICPATEEPFGAAPTGTFTDANRAIDAARHALRTAPWADSTGVQRAQWMRALADELAARGDDTARLVSNENGMPISLARVAEGQGPAATLRYYAGLAEAMPAEERRPANQPGRVTVVRREPGESSPSWCPGISPSRSPCSSWRRLRVHRGDQARLRDRPGRVRLRLSR